MQLEREGFTLHNAWLRYNVWAWGGCIAEIPTKSRHAYRFGEEHSVGKGDFQAGGSEVDLIREELKRRSLQLLIGSIGSNLVWVLLLYPQYQ